MKCPYCGSEAVLKDSSVIYGMSFGMVWLCLKYPNCDARVGVHRGTNKPLGTLANSELRDLRLQCHETFDSFWHRQGWGRHKAYGELSRIMKVDKKLAHIACFNESQRQPPLLI